LEEETRSPSSPSLLSKRYFSESGNIITEKRTLLNYDRAKELIFARDNFFLLQLFIKRWRLDDKEFQEEDKAAKAAKEKEKDKETQGKEIKLFSLSFYHVY
jgi:hypothetical protein